MAAWAVGGGTVLPFALSAFFSGRPGGGIDMPSSDQILRTFDPELWGAIDVERARQENHVELVASGNYTSPRVSAAQGSLLTDQHADGYPGKRDRGGCDFIDVAERLAVDRCRQLFRAEYANVQPHSGSQANQAVHLALLNPGDTILGMSLAHGGCPTRSEPVGRSGKIHHEVAYGLDADEVIDYAQVEALAHRHRPRLIVADASAYWLRIDFKRFRRIADAVGALLMVDMTHHAGLVAAGLYPSPVGVADVVVGSTDKTLRGPGGGFILACEAWGHALDSAVFPSVQGSPMAPMIAAKAVAFLEAMSPAFRAYQERVIDNAATLARVLAERGLRIVSGRTECHMMLVDLRAIGITGDEAEAVLGRVHVSVDKNAIPNDPRQPAATSGLRLGSPAVTTRGFGPAEIEQLGHVIADVLGAPRDDAVVARSASAVTALCARFPVHGQPMVPPARHSRPTLVVAR